MAGVDFGALERPAPEIESWIRLLSEIRALPEVGGNMQQMAPTRVEELVRLGELIGKEGAPFFYIAGPMTGKKQFNFPRFDYATSRCRDEGMPIVSPVELDELVDPHLVEIARASADGTEEMPYREMLARDLQVIALQNCVGVILLEGWEDSLGAGKESSVARFLGKELLLYSEDSDGKVVLTACPT